MSSRFKVEISAQVNALLAWLAKHSRAEAREIALLLLRLERDPEPPGSRELEPTLVERMPGERVWERADWTVTYWVDPPASVVVVGSVERSSRQGYPPPQNLGAGEK